MIKRNNSVFVIAYLIFLFYVTFSCKTSISDEKNNNRKIHINTLIRLSDDSLGIRGNEVSWSPDGEYFCYSPLGSQDIWLVSSSGGEPIKIFSFPPPDSIFVKFGPVTPSWSPDSKRILFINSFFHEMFNLLILYIEDTSVVPLVIQNGENIYSGGHCSWSPDGNTIAFIHKLSDLMLVPDTGGVPVTLFSPGFELWGPPAWSPDGQSIALSVRNGPSNKYDIFLISLSGDFTILPVSSSKYSEHNPDWSPDGTMIAFSSKIEGNSDIYVYDFINEKTTRLTTYEGYDSDPSWSPDSKRIAFISDRSGTRDIWIMELNYHY